MNYRTTSQLIARTKRSTGAVYVEAISVALVFIIMFAAMLLMSSIGHAWTAAFTEARTTAWDTVYEGTNCDSDATGAEDDDEVREDLDEGFDDPSGELQNAPGGIKGVLLDLLSVFVGASVESEGTGEYQGKGPFGRLGGSLTRRMHLLCNEPKVESTIAHLMDELGGFFEGLLF